MFAVKKEKNKASVLKFALIIVSVTAAVVVAVIIWKKKRIKDKQIEEEIDAAIDAAFAEKSAVTADLKISETEEI